VAHATWFQAIPTHLPNQDTTQIRGRRLLRGMLYEQDSTKSAPCLHNLSRAKDVSHEKTIRRAARALL
jgi:hypothetical protein